eukprot:gene33381-42796_t
MSCFNMDEANVEEHKARFELYDKEARVMLEKRLPIPAYDQLLKSSHAFNILDARGAAPPESSVEYQGGLRQQAPPQSSVEYQGGPPAAG